MRPRVLIWSCAILCIAGVAQATSFIVPSDEELIAKSTAIVVGIVEGSYFQETETIETVYEIRLESALKGRFHEAERSTCRWFGVKGAARNVL